MSHRGMPVTRQRRAERRNQAAQRQAAYDALSTQEKLDRLPANGAKRQRDRLTALLKKESSKSQTSTTSVVDDAATTQRKTSKKSKPRKQTSETESE